MSRNVKLPKDDEWVALVDQIMKGTDDRAVVVLAGSLIDAVLEQLLISWLLPDDAVTQYFDPPHGFLSTSGATTNLAFALALVSHEERDDLKQVAKVRNVFAHHLLDATFEHPDVVKHLKGLKSVKGLAPEDSPRARFRKAVSQLVVSLRTFRTLEPTTAEKFRRLAERRLEADWRRYVRKHYKRKTRKRRQP